MTRRRHVLIALPALVAAPLSAFAAETVVGSGKAAKEQRSIGAFAAIGLDGAMKVIVRPAERESIEIEADDNVLQHIETTLRGDGDTKSLRLRFTPNLNLRTRTPVVVRIGFVRLSGVAVGGSGSISGSGVKGQRLDAALGGSGSIALDGVETTSVDASIGGSGSITLAGKAGKLRVSIGGSGDFDAKALTVDDATVTIGGSGNAKVRAERTLDVSIAGSGDVLQSGAAQAHSAIAGSGRVRRL